jgi:hypothetical protein
MPLLLSTLPEILRSRVHLVSIQELLQEIRSAGEPSWVAVFADKYALPP